MENQTAINELNTLLQGTYMGIRSLEHYIEKTEDDLLRKNFQRMQQEVKVNAIKIAERIQNLGGVLVDSEGFTGSMQGYFHKMMIPSDSHKMIEDALDGMEKYGVQYSEELVKGDLDPLSRQLAEEVIDTNRKLGEELKQFLEL